MAIALSVNLNKIALVRNSREGDSPNIETFARLALDAGAKGITVHPRPDARHVRPSDVYRLREVVAQYPGTEFNIEGNPFAAARGDYPGLLSLVKDTKPHQCTLVPDSDSQLTSDHGFDLAKDGERLVPILNSLRTWGVRSSLFMDPDTTQIERAKTITADRIELYTGPFAEAYAENPDSEQTQALYRSFEQAAIAAHELGLGVNAGHDLNLENMQLFKALPNLAEVSIGHALTIDAWHLGFSNAVKAYLEVCA